MSDRLRMAAERAAQLLEVMRDAAWSSPTRTVTTTATGEGWDKVVTDLRRALDEPATKSAVSRFLESRNCICLFPEQSLRGVQYTARFWSRTPFESQEVHSATPEAAAEAALAEIESQEKREPVS